MQYIEEAEQALFDKKFSLAQVDECRKTVCKKYMVMPRAMYRYKFLLSGGSHKEWNDILYVFRHGHRKAHEVPVSAIFDFIHVHYGRECATK